MELPTKEQLEQYQRLGRIFLPYNNRQIERLYPGTAGGARFAHYTSADAALKIIGSKRLWMRNATCMSDYSEVLYGFGILKDLFDRRRDEFVAALDACAPGASLNALRAFDANWQTIRGETFIASLSEHQGKEDFHGRLSMWRGIAATGVRVAMVVRIPFFSGASLALRVFFSPVAYFDKGEVDNELTTVMRNVKEHSEFLRGVDPQLIGGTVITMLLAAVTCLKHEGFGEELEWRAIHQPLMGAAAAVQMQRSTEVVNGVPQHVYQLPLDASVSPALAELDIARIFDRLIIGPTPYPASVRAAFIEALGTAGVQEPMNKVLISGIPIRT